MCFEVEEERLGSGVEGDTVELNMGPKLTQKIELLKSKLRVLPGGRIEKRGGTKRFEISWRGVLSSLGMHTSRDSGFAETGGSTAASLSEAGEISRTLRP